MPDATLPPPGRRGRRGRLLGGALTLAIVAVVYLLVLPRIADYRDVWGIVRDDLAWSELLALAAAVLLNLATFAPPWMAALPGLRYRQAFVMSQASTALSIVSPAGATVGMAGSYSLLRSWGYPRGLASRAVGLAGVWNQLATLLFPVAALALLAAAGGYHPALQTAALAGLAACAVLLGAFAVALSSGRHARRLGDLAARAASRVRGLLRLAPVAWGGEQLAAFRSDTLDLLRRRWHALTLATLAGHLTVFAVLAVCLRAVGVPGGQVSLPEAFAAWSLVRLLGALPLTPGGIGLVELGLTTALVAFGAPNADAVAATLLYRALTVLPTLALGLLAAVTWRRHRPGGRLESGR